MTGDWPDMHSYVRIAALDGSVWYRSVRDTVVVIQSSKDGWEVTITADEQSSVDYRRKAGEKAAGFEPRPSRRPRQHRRGDPGI